MLFAALASFVVSAAAWAQTVDKPMRAVTDPGVVTTNQAITPAGVQTVFKGRVHDVAFGADGEVWALSRTHLYRLDWLNNRALDTVELPGAAGVRGLTYDGAGKRPIVTYAATRQGKPAEAMVATVQGGALAPLSALGGEHIAGEPAIVGSRVLVPLTHDNVLAVTSLKGSPTQRIPVGVAPVTVAAHGDVAYVANWGGQAAEAGAASAPTGLEPDADRVAIDARGIAREGSVSIVDLNAGRVTGRVTVGRHPTAITLNAAGTLLYVANANEDSVSIIDTKTQRVRRTIKLQPFAAPTDGLAPTALVLDEARQRLLIAAGGINAVIVYDLRASRIAGMIPTSWYPVAVTLNADGRTLAVATLLGVGSGQNDGPTKRFVHANRGAIHIVPMPDDAQLLRYTAAVALNNRMTLAGGSPPRPNPRAPVRAVPLISGEPSTIEHVVYIIKENRTYDQVFGDLERGNGEPTFVMYGEDVTPNTRKLAREFVLLDNFYATGGNSANGHQWVTQANEASYTLWPGYAGRSYPFDGTDPLAYARSGFIWDAALSRNKTVAVFGEFVPRVSWGDEERKDLLRRWRDGETIVSPWNTTSPIPTLDKIVARDFPGYSMGIPDVVRAQIFLKHLARYEAEGKMPNLTIMLLPCDHTMGTRPGSSSPKAMVADNDLALGQVVEALTKSRFWPKMAILVVEDDAQNGVDHVDGHRTVALAISPYSRRGAVDSTFYAQQSMVKTIQLMLGLPSLSMFDLIANDMRASFQDTPDLRGFTHVVPKQDIFEINPPASALNGAQREGALASARMRFDVPDAVPSALLNRITWHDARGWQTPYPGSPRAVFSPYHVEDEEDSDDEETSGDGIAR
jgi:YVTN family beta-propeller protein